MSEKEEKTFGKRVKEIRKRLKLNQTEFGNGLCLSLQHISAVEKDSSKPGHDFFYNIVKNYRVNLQYLLFNEGEMLMGEEKKGYHMMYDFRKLMGEDGESIKRLMKKPWGKDLVPDK